MGEGEASKPSFGRLVFGKALHDTTLFLKYTKRDIALGAITLILGGGLAYLFVGKADTVKEIVFIAAFTFAPAGIVMITVFAWHLWLAPAALAYEVTTAIGNAIAYAGSPTATSVPVISVPAINWEPWRAMPDYSVQQFAKILARTDAGDTKMTTEAIAYRDLMMKCMENNTLPYIKEYALNDWNGRKYEKRRDYATRIKRDDALFWARDHKFPTDHIE